MTYVWIVIDEIGQIFTFTRKYPLVHWIRSSADYGPDLIERSKANGKAPAVDVKEQIMEEVHAND